jgi:hypothetical protein
MTPTHGFEKLVYTAVNIFLFSLSPIKRMALILFFLGNRRSFTPYWNFIEKIYSLQLQASTGSSGNKKKLRKKIKAITQMLLAMNL